MHCKSYSHFFSKKFQHICISLDVNFNESLTNDVVSFEQLGPRYVKTLTDSFSQSEKAFSGSSITIFHNASLDWIHVVDLRNRSTLAVICCVIINHCLEVSCKVDEITSAEREWFIYLQLTDKLWFITQQIMQKSWSILILTHRKRRKSNCILQILPTFRHRIRNPTNSFDCNAVVYMHFLHCWREKNDVTPSIVVERNTDVSSAKMTSERRQTASRASAQWFVAE